MTESDKAAKASRVLSGPALLAEDEFGNTHITEAGREYLDAFVTDTDGEIYAFTEEMGVLEVAAGMARTSRSSDDVRAIVLKEFILPRLKAEAAGEMTPGMEDKLLARIITEFGDDSVQQLMGVHLAVEGASNLMTKQLEWGRLAAYLEQSTRFLFFDRKDKHGRFKYFVPSEIAKNKALAERYQGDMDAIFTSYQLVVRALTEHVRQTTPLENPDQKSAWLASTRAKACDAARTMLPVATKSTVCVYASGQAIEGMIMRLLSEDLQEARHVGQGILEEARKVMGSFLQRADRPDRGGATSAYLADKRTRMQELIPADWQTRQQPVETGARLIGSSHENELDIVPDMLFPHTSLSLDEIKARVEKDMSEQEKIEVFQAYIGNRLNRRHRPGRALENIHYYWDIVCDYGIFRDLQRHRMVDNLTWQSLTPHLGHRMPELIDQAGLAETWQKAFSISAALFELIAEKINPMVAQYAVLLGHNMRWQITYNARQAFHLHELRTAPQGHEGYRRLTQSMHEQVTGVHPLIGAAMTFVNKDEDPALGRLAAEQHQQLRRRLEALDA